VVNDDVLYSYRLRLFSLAAELGNVRAACRIFGIHHSLDLLPLARTGPALGPRDAPPARVALTADANQTRHLIEQRVLAFPLGHLGLGPDGLVPASRSTAGAESSPAPTAI
jgi:hypothetical protein